MKITYTIAEAIAALTNGMSEALPSMKVTVEILPDVQPTGQHQLDAYARMIANYGGTRLDVNKISAIKMLRDSPAFTYLSVNGSSQLGMRDAKYIVEADVRDVLNYYANRQTLMGFSYGK